jgi:hypothetical protein
MFAGLPTDDVLAAQLESAVVAEAAGDWMSETFAAMGRSGYLMGVAPAEAEAWVVRASDAARRAGNPFAIGLSAVARGRYLGFNRRPEEARSAFVEAEARFAEIGDHRSVLVARSDLAHALRRAGSLDAAEAANREVISEWQRLGHRGAVASLLESFAYLAIERGDAPRATALLGAADRLRREAESHMLDPERLEYDSRIAQARATLDGPEFDLAWGRGAAMTSEDAVAFAIAG